MQMNLNGHLSIHIGEKPYQISDQQISAKGPIRKHIHIYIENKPYQV